MLQKQLLLWYNQNKRNLPWRNTENPYLIWLSEVILQQTRVQQGLPYFHRFVENYPNIFDLAQAEEDEVMKLWQGLGYYSRARNMHQTAKLIVNTYDGIFPDSYEKLLLLKGIGPYTAAAIASFAFQEPVAVLDGNVFRVLARLHAIDLPINQSGSRKLFQEYAQKFLDTKNPATHNQAIMELGSQICTPTQPKCVECPLISSCAAYKLNQQNKFPIKEKKVKIKHRFLYYFWLTVGAELAVFKRGEGDIWQNLYDLPFIESESELTQAEFSIAMAKIKFNTLVNLADTAFEVKHILTHQRLFAKFYILRLNEKPELQSTVIWVQPEQLKQLPIPRLLDKFIKR
jgi:A/G-specific adenine glycosylase